MKKNSLPICSVIVLNYYGEKVIKNTLNSLLALDYPREKVEIIVVDNNSKDKSLTILDELEEKIPNLRVIPLNKNLGFSKGNNVGIKAARGEFVALLNNDCIVSPNWLKELVKTALSEPDLFAVTSKILLYQKYLGFEILLNSETSFFYAYLDKSSLYNYSKKRIYFNLVKKNNNYYYTEIPFDPISDKIIEVNITVTSKKNLPSYSIEKLIKLPEFAKILETERIKDEITYKIEINLKSQQLVNKTIDKIQNAGIIPFWDGYARDIGAVIRHNTHYYEYDEGQYNRQTEVYAFCGAAVLINKKHLQTTGSLEELFFMYYEDVELSERARLNNYKIFYSPAAIVRHIHTLSAKSGSKFFTYNVEKGRLLHVFLNYPKGVFLNQILSLVAIIAFDSLNLLVSIKYLKAILKDKSGDKPNYQRLFLMLSILTYFLLKLPYLIYVRTRRKYSKTLRAKNYESILSGRWYFN